MFLTPNQIANAIKKLEPIHPFYGTTFLACKIANLPIDNTIDIQIADIENNILNSYYNPDEESKFFFRVFVASANEQRWVSKKKYAASTLQSTRTRGAFHLPFIHPTGSSLWGWTEKYIDVLKSNLTKNKYPYKGRPIPAFDLAVWLYRDFEWGEKPAAEDIISKFTTDFKFTALERKELLDLSIPSNSHELFQEQKITLPELRKIVGSPPDAQPAEGGTLAYLELKGVGPAKTLIFEPAERLSLITGDNGLGKTFLLECAWWALTGQWANPNLPAYPRQDRGNVYPEIIFQIAGDLGSDEKTKIRYNWSSPSIDKWPIPTKRPTISGLLLYVRVDGSFAVYDPVGKLQSQEIRGAIPRSFVFTREQVWDGFDENIGGQKRSVMNGLIRDWVSWQNDPDTTTFNTFQKVLSRLSPPAKSDLGQLNIGSPVRLPDDSRAIPTIEHSYGPVPIVHVSAGVRRIITIAYLLVWAWTEHQINCREARVEQQKRMVLLIDELEAHLHPHWQRRILPALLEVKDDLTDDSELQVQSIIATHSPLVMASAEPKFDPEYDKLFHLDIIENDLPGGEVTMKELPFIRRGLVDLWLTSDVFELMQARSLEGEQAIEEAKALQQKSSPSQEEVQIVSSKLLNSLSERDSFWPRWSYFAEQHGVKL